MSASADTASGAPAWEDRPIWVDLASGDPEGSRAFYARLFGWQIDVNPDPQYGGYAVATSGGDPVAGIGSKMTDEAPTAWSLYIGTTDADALATRVTAAGGTIVVPPMTVGDQGRMAIFQDPSGAFLGAWQPISMAGFAGGRPNSFQWAELNARGLERAAAFYRDVFGWTAETVPTGEGQPPYTRFARGDDPVAGGMEMHPGQPAAVPSYWMVYFSVTDVEAAFRMALDAGASEMLPPMPFPGGRFAILRDPQGAVLGLHEVSGG